MSVFDVNVSFYTSVLGVKHLMFNTVLQATVFNIIKIIKTVVCKLFYTLKLLIKIMYKRAMRQTVLIKIIRSSFRYIRERLCLSDGY